MNAVKWFCVVIAIGAIGGCASLGVFSGARAEFDKGIGLFSRGQYEGAVTCFEKAIELDPEYGDAYLYLGRSYLNLGRWGEAISPLRTALRLAPEKSKSQIMTVLLDALLGAASSKFKRGDFRSSVDLLKEALTLQPNSEPAKGQLTASFLGLGAALLAEGNAGEAIDSFKKALELSPNNAAAYLGLAQAFVKSGDLFKALQAAQGAMNIDPSNPTARSLLDQLMR
jgi:tetratricopeptide (TPR) repeat protein